MLIQISDAGPVIFIQQRDIGFQVWIIKMPAIVIKYFKTKMSTIFLSVKPDLSCFESFCHQCFHHDDRLLAAGSKRVLQDIIRDNDRTVSFNGDPGKNIREIIIVKSVI